MNRRTTPWQATKSLSGFGAKVAVEIDGLAFHPPTPRLHRDRQRQKAIAIAGWQVLRFTWLDSPSIPNASSRQSAGAIMEYGAATQRMKVSTRRS